MEPTGLHGGDGVGNGARKNCTDVFFGVVSVNILKTGEIESDLSVWCWVS